MTIRDLPIYRLVSVDSCFVDDDQTAYEAVFLRGPVAHIDRPPQLVGKSNAYAAYIMLPFMRPKFEVGNIIYIDPSLPYRQGDYAVFIPTDPADQVRFRYLDSVCDKRFRLRQHAPEKTATINRNTIAAIHVIVGTWEAR